MIDEIGGEEFFKHLKIPTALNLFGIPTHDRDSGIR
jgi:hypothetical protein